MTNSQLELLRSDLPSLRNFIDPDTETEKLCRFDALDLRKISYNRFCEISALETQIDYYLDAFDDHDIELPNNIKTDSDLDDAIENISYKIIELLLTSQ